MMIWGGCTYRDRIREVLCVYVYGFIAASGLRPYKGVTHGQEKQSSSLDETMVAISGLGFESLMKGCAFPGIIHCVYYILVLVRTSTFTLGSYFQNSSRFKIII
jgi:hypothetical protein